MPGVCILEKKPDKALRSIEYVIDKPDFTEEIEACKKFEAATSRGITSPNHLRSILQEIANKYDNMFNPLATVPISSYTGLPYKNESDLNIILNKIINNHSPKTVLEYIRYKIKHRPKNIRVIYIISAPSKDLKKMLAEEGVPEMTEDNLYEELNFKTGVVRNIGNVDLSTKRKTKEYEDVKKDEEEKVEKSNVKKVKKTKKKEKTND